MEFGDDSSVYQRSLSPRRGVDSESKEQDSYREVGQYVTRAWIVSRSVSPSLSPLLPCLHVGHVHRIRVHVSFFKSFATAAKRIPFRPAASSIHRFCKISGPISRLLPLDANYLRGRPIDGGRRTRGSV